MSQFTASNDEDHGVSATAHTAAQEASAVAETAGGAARSVVETGAHEAAAVAGETKARIGDLVSQSGRELSDQAAGQQQRLAAGLGTIGDDLSRMADADENGGMAGDLVRRVAGHASTVGTWLGDRDPQQLMRDVTTFARRRPGTFIAVAALAGIVVGRLSRSIAAGAASGDSTSSGPADGPRFADADARARAAETPAPVDSVPVTGGLVATDASTEPGLDVGDSPLYTESAARLEGTQGGTSNGRSDSL